MPDRPLAGSDCRHPAPLRRCRKLGVLTSLLACAGVGHAVGSDLESTPDGRWLQRAANDEPVFLLGETIYNCWGNSSRDDIRELLDKRRAMGYRHVKFYADMREENVWRESPNPSGIYSDAYYRFVDFIVEQARLRGMYVNFVERDTPKISEDQWRWLGARYRDQPNIIWTAWDASEFSEARQGLADGLAGVRERWSESHPGFSLFLLNTYFSGTEAGHRLNAIVGGVAGATSYSDFTSLYEAANPQPILHEDGYYTDGNVGSLSFRRSIWRMFLEGAYVTVGHDDWYGMCCGWESALDQDGPARTALFGAFWRGREWWKTVRSPDRISGGDARNRAAIANDGSALYVYFAASGSTTVDLGAVAADEIRCTWLDVVDGAYHDAGTFAGGPQGFDLPDGWEDGLLIVEPAHDRPLVSLTTPELGSSTNDQKDNTNAYSVGDDVTVRATASAMAGRSIANVEFLINGEVFASDSSEPYVATIADAPAGTYLLQARAIDSADEAALSPARCIAVWEIQQPDVAITTPATLPPGVVGQSYLHYLESFESTAKYWEVWTRSVGDLPPGMFVYGGQWGESSAGYNGTPTTAGTYEFTMRVSPSTAEGHSGTIFGPASKAFSHVIRPDPGANQPPVVTVVNAERMVVSGRDLSIGGSAVDPEGDDLTLWWAKEWGPGTVTFADAGSASTTATFDWPGFYELRLYADDGANMWQWDTVFVTVTRSASPTPPPASAQRQVDLRATDGDDAMATEVQARQGGSLVYGPIIEQHHIIRELATDRDLLLELLSAPPTGIE